MGTWIWLGSIAATGLIVWWVRRRAEEVIDYYQQEGGEPPVFDAGSYLGGDR